MARLLPPESSAIDVVSREVGISVATLERWRAEALANGSGERSGASNQRWTAAARLQAVIATAAMDEATRSAWCREQGLYPADLDAWKQDAIAGLGEPRATSAAEARDDRLSHCLKLDVTGRRSLPHLRCYPRCPFGDDVPNTGGHHGEDDACHTHGVGRGDP